MSVAMSVSVPSAVVAISGLGISGPLAVVSVSTAIAVSVAVTSIAVSSAVVAIAGLGISGPLAVVAVAGLSGSSGLGISLSLRLGISRPLAVVSTVSAIVASPVSSIAIATAVVTISGLGRHHSEEGDGESDQKFHVLSSSFSTGLPM